MKWTEARVIERLRAHYAALDARYGQTGTHSLLTQVPVSGRIIDVLVLADDPIERTGIERTAIEVKVNRADYRSETDAKRAASWQIAHRCLYAAPAGLIDPASLPDGWGLYEVHETADAVLVEYGREHPPTVGMDPVTDMALLRCAAAEDAIRLGEEATPAEVARMRYELDQLHGIASRAKDTARREMKRAKAARSELLAVAGDQECAACEQKVTWRRGGANDSTWSHVDQAHDAKCTEIRREADRLRRERETGASYSWGFATPIEPKAIRDQRLAEQRMETVS
jgi:hypothetical protein